MRVSSSIALAVVAALASSTSAKPAAAPDTAGADSCPTFCRFNYQCIGCIVQQFGALCVVSHVSTFHIGAV
ncbi:hypothetical protein P692DRAFT_20827492 [Suillus brevipes Sb2]|nr:hypothetical protein P692DRAFT_20827492 [Suillus brevipes Sb2]